MAKPATTYTWADQSGAYTATPTTAEQNLGFPPGEASAVDKLNEVLRATGAWLDFLDGHWIDDGDIGLSVITPYTGSTVYFSDGDAAPNLCGILTSNLAGAYFEDGSGDYARIATSQSPIAALISVGDSGGDLSWITLDRSSGDVDIVADNDLDLQVGGDLLVPDTLVLKSGGVTKTRHYDPARWAWFDALGASTVWTIASANAGYLTSWTVSTTTIRLRTGLPLEGSSLTDASVEWEFVETSGDTVVSLNLVSYSSGGSESSTTLVTRSSSTTGFQTETYGGAAIPLASGGVSWALEIEIVHTGASTGSLNVREVSVDFRNTIIEP